MMKGFACFVLVVVLLQLFNEGDAKGECCRPKPGYSNGQVTLNCGDCKPGTPYCGVGRCNIFGCNCDNGCRHGKCDGHSTEEKVFAEIDKDHDGKISPEEGRHYLQAQGVGEQQVERAMAALGAPTDGHYDATLMHSDVHLDD